MTESELDILADKIAGRLAILPRWMTLKQAVAYSNLGKGRLLDLVQRKKVKGFQDKALQTKPWRFDKESIDYFMENQWIIDDDDDELNEKAFAILERTGL